jgi:hypothetical protein
MKKKLISVIMVFITVKYLLTYPFYSTIFASEI